MNKALPFITGFLSCMFLISAIILINDEFPAVTGLTGPFQYAPSDRIQESDIALYPDKIVIYIPNASLSRYADTGSMKPLLDEFSNGIRIRPQSVDDIEVGDIISYRKEGTLVVHRVTDKGIDEKGSFFIAQGDANATDDGKIRFKEIEYLTTGVLY